MEPVPFALLALFAIDSEKVINNEQQEAILQHKGQRRFMALSEAELSAMLARIREDFRNGKLSAGAFLLMKKFIEDRILSKRGF
jgi:cell division protein FtsB